MIELIEQNKFEELKEKVQNSDSSFDIYKFLVDVLSQNKVEVDGESFNAEKYQDEFFEGLNIYKALNNSEISETEFNEYSNILVQLAFKTAGFTRLMADTATRNGVHLSDIDSYRVHSDLRAKFQEFIDLLKEKKDVESIANVAAAKAQITTSIGNLLKKEDIGIDMLQFAKSYANVGQTEQAIQIYKGIMNDFESESVKNSSRLFPEISQIDTRPKVEIEIFEKAKEQYEMLSGDKVREVKRVHIDNDEQARKLVEEVHKKEKEIINGKKSNEQGFLRKLKNLFKKN